MTPVFYRIHIDRISGRQAMAGRGRPVESPNLYPVRDGSGWLTRVLRALSRPFFDTAVSLARLFVGRPRPSIHERKTL